MTTAGKWVPIKRLRTKAHSNGYAPVRIYYFKFKLKNGETVSFTSDGCIRCMYLKRPESCVKNITSLFVPQEAWFRMGITNGRRNCAVNPKKKIKPTKWIPVKERYATKKPPATREALVLWEGLKQYAGNQTENGNYEITRFIDNTDMFRKALHFGVIIKDDNSGKWALVKPEGGKDSDSEKKPKKKEKKFSL